MPNLESQRQAHPSFAQQPFLNGHRKTYGRRSPTDVATTGGTAWCCHSRRPKFERIKKKKSGRFDSFRDNINFQVLQLATGFRVRICYAWWLNGWKGEKMWQRAVRWKGNGFENYVSLSVDIYSEFCGSNCISRKATALLKRVF